MDSLDKHFRQITRSAFERYGFAHGDLVAQWAAIVGDDLARRCSPEKMAWPKGREADPREARGATLSVKCDHGAGLALSYETGRIADLVNAYYGYMAVTTVKVVQGIRPASAQRKPAATTAPAEIAAKVQAKVGTVNEPELKAALTRLGEAALTTATLSQAGKLPR